MRLIVILISIVSFSMSYSQSEEELIQNIRKIYKETRVEYPNMHKDKRELNNFQTTEGGEITGVHDTSGLRLIEAVYMGETGKKTTEYYYHKGKLYFVFEQNYTYNAPIYYDEEMAKESGGEAFDPKKSTIISNRYYFHKNKLIRWLDNQKKKVDLKSDLAKQKAKDVLQNSDLFWDSMNK